MKVGLVLGGAACLWADVRAFREFADPEECTIIAVNDAGFAWPGRLDHWASLHAEEFAWRRQKRAAHGYPYGYVTWGRGYPIGLEHLARAVDRTLGADWVTDGSSGWLGIGVAWTLGLRRIVLAGMPMDGGGRIARAGGWRDHTSYRGPWVRERDKLAPYLRSMSGWTAELFGRPDAAFLDLSTNGRHSEKQTLSRSPIGA